MDKYQLIKEVQQLMGEAQAGQALQTLLDFFNKNPQYQTFSAYALQIKAALQENKNKAELGVLSSDQVKANNNQINYQILELLDHVKKDDFNWRPGKKQMGSRVITLSLSTAIVLILGIYFLVQSLQKEPATEVEVQNMEAACPTFEPNTRFNIIVFPYGTYDNNQLKPHQAVLERLIELGQTYDINLGIDFFNADENTPLFPKNDTEFSDFAKECRANLAIWGRSEKLTDKTILKTQYKFLDVKESFLFNRIKIKEDTEIDTVQSISSIANNGIVTENIEQAILLLFGVIASEIADPEVAIAALKKVEVNDSASTLLKGMTLADSYLRNDKPEKAVGVYDEVLETHPDYWFALNNRGMLKYQTGEYEQSIVDLSNTIALRPTDTAALSVRGAAYTKIGQVAKAKKDLKMAKSLDPNDQSIDDKIKSLEKKEVELKRKEAELEQQVEKRPNDVQALHTTASTNYNLGDYNKSIEYSEKAIRTNPKDAEAHITKIKSLIELGDSTKVQESIRTAIKNGVKAEDIQQAIPELNPDNSTRIIRRN